MKLHSLYFCLSIIFYFIIIIFNLFELNQSTSNEDKVNYKNTKKKKIINKTNKNEQI